MDAQTNIQLYEQLRAGGYPSADLGIVHAAYGLASHLYAGRFQASGKVFLAHLVGVASALAALGQPAATVAAGLLHNAYRTGDFGRGPAGVSDAKRRSIASAVGEEAEAHVHGFATIPWKRRAVRAACDRPEALSARERSAFLLRLADVLDHHRDLGILYCADAETRRARIHRDGPAQVELARALGFPALAAALGQAFEEAVAAKVPPELRDIPGRSHSFVLSPPSHRPRWSALAGLDRVIELARGGRG